VKIEQYLTIFAAFGTLVLTEAIFFYPQSFYALIVILNAAILYSVYRITKKSQTPAKSWYNFYILPFCFLNSTIIYLLVLSNAWLVQGLAIFAAVFIYLYLNSIFLYHHLPALYKSFQIENISSYGNFLAVFFLSSALYGLQSFLGWPVWLIMLLLTIFFLLAIYQVNWANKIAIADSSAHIFVHTLILVELAWTLSFLPLGFNILGLMLAASYYVLAGISRHFLQGSLDGKVVKTYLGIAALCVIIILLSARWI